MRRFRRICEHTQSVVSVIRRPPPPSSPRAQRRVTSGPTVPAGSTVSNATNMIIGGKSSAARVPATGYELIFMQKYALKLLSFEFLYIALWRRYHVHLFLHSS